MIQKWTKQKFEFHTLVPSGERFFMMVAICPKGIFDSTLMKGKEQLVLLVCTV